MFKTKSEVDRHVNSCLKKINNETERNLRCLSFAKLYFNVGDYDQAYRYISSYLSVKPKSAEAYQLLGKSLEKLGKLDAALDAYKNSLQIDPKQNTLVIKVCELLSSDNVELDLSGARYFCDLAQSFDPNNPAVHSLKERLITTNESPYEISQLLLKELEIRPTDIKLRIRLIKHFIQSNMIKEAYKHASAIEEKDIPSFYNNINWYENFAEVLLRFQKDVSLDSEINWDFWFLSVSVLERLAALSLDDRNNVNSSMNSLTTTFNFDQMLHKAAQNISNCPDRQLVSVFLSHYQMQLHFHFSTLILKQAKKGIMPIKEAANMVLPTLFTAYNSNPLDLQSIWYLQSSDKTKKLVQKWYRDAYYRCSQTGHILLAMAKDKKSLVLEKAAQYSSGAWREQLYKKLFLKRDQHIKMSSSFFVNNAPPAEPTLKLPDSSDLIKYDEISQLSFPNSLHHYVWIMLNSNIADVNIVTFEGIQFSTKNLMNCSAESISLLDIYAFMCCATICANSNLNDNKLSYYYLLPASITASLGTIEQSNFIESAYKMYKNETSSQLGDIRALLIKGIEVVRCVGHHGLDVKILVQLANIFEDRSKKLTKQSEIDFNIARAELYWKTALPLLEKIKNDQKIAYPNNRLFQIKSSEVTISEASIFIEKGRLFIGAQLMKKKEFEQALSILEQLKDPYASFFQFEIYEQYAEQIINGGKSRSINNENKREIILFLTKARDCLYLTLDRLRGPNIDIQHPLNGKIGTELEKVERMLSDMESDNINDMFSDVNRSLDVSIGEQYLSSLTHVSHSNYTSKLGNLSQSTPLRHSILRQEARPSPERMDAQIRELMSMKDSIFSLVDVQKCLVERLNSVVDDLKSIKKEVETLKDVTKSVNDIKSSIDDFQNVTDVIQEMKKELVDFKKSDTKNQLSDEDLYILDPDYGVDYNVGSTASAFPTAVPGAYPNFPAGRIPNPSHVAAAYGPPVLYPGLYPGLPYAYGGLNLTQPGTLPFLQDQQGPNIATSVASHLLTSQPSLNQNLGLDALGGQVLTQTASPSAQFIKDPSKDSTGPVNLSKLPSTSIFGKSPLNQNLGLDALSGQVLTQTAPPSTQFVKDLSKDPVGTVNLSKLPSTSIFGKAPPVNVVITTSDPLPAQNTLTSQPVLSVTIPPQHIKANFMKPETTANPVVKDAAAASAVSVLKSKIITPEQNKTPIESNTSNISSNSTEDFEPSADFKPIIPLPDEVPVSTGEEGETELFCARAKLYRHVNTADVKEWKERGVGNIKILKNPDTGNIRVLMRRDQVHKICANHYITADMSLIEVPNNDRSFIWACQDFAEGEIARETFMVKFKLVEDAKKFYDTFKSSKKTDRSLKIGSTDLTKKAQEVNKETPKTSQSTTSLGGFVFTGTPTFLPKDIKTPAPITEVKEASKPITPFSTFVFGKSDTKTEPIKFSPLVISQEKEKEKDERSSSPVEEFVPTAEFKPVIPLPELVELKTGEENCEVLFEEKAKLYRLDTSGETKEWKERGIGIMKVLKDDSVRLLMRRDQVHKVCCNHRILKDMIFQINSTNPKAVVWQAQDFSEGVLQTEVFTIRFKTEEIANKFLQIIQKEQGSLSDKNGTPTPVKENVTGENKNLPSVTVNSKADIEKSSDSNDVSVGFGDKFKSKPGSWECTVCMLRNESSATSCVACNALKNPSTVTKVEGKKMATLTFKSSARPVSETKPVVGFGDKFKPKPGSWECKVCMIKNEGKDHTCVACETPREGGLKQNITADKKVTVPEQKFVFGIVNTAPTSVSGQTKPPIIADISTTASATNTPEKKWTFGIPQATPVTVTFGKDSTPSSVDKSQSVVTNQSSLSFISPTKQEFEFKQRPSRKISQGHDESDADGSYVEEEEDNLYFKPVVPLPDKIQVKTGEEDEDILYSHRAKLYRFVSGEWKERGIGDIKILRNKTNGKLRVVMRREQVLKICLNHILTKNVEYIPKDKKSLMFAVADFSEGEIANEKFCLRFKTPEITEEFQKAVRNAVNGISTESKGTSDSNEDVVIVSETQVTPEEEQEALKLGLPPKFMSYKQLPDCNCEQCKKDDEYLKTLFATETSKKVDNVVTDPSKFSFASITGSPTTTVAPNSTSKDASPNKSSSLIKSSILTPPNANKTAVTSSSIPWPPSTTANMFSSNNSSFGNGLFSTNKLFGNSTPGKENNSLFSSIATTDVKTTSATNSVFSTGSSNTSIFNFDNQQPFKPQFSNIPNIFGQNTPSTTSSNIFNQNSTTPNIFAQNKNPPLIFGQGTPTSVSSNIFSQNVSTNTTPSVFSNTSINTPSNIFAQTTPTTTVNIFGSKNPPTTALVFGQGTPTASTPSGLGQDTPTNSGLFNVFGQSTPASGSIFGNKTFNVASVTEDKNKTAGFLFGKGGMSNTSSDSTPKVSETTELKETDEIVLKCKSDLSFASLAAKISTDAKPAFKKDESFSFLGAGTQVFASTTKPTADASKGESDDENNYSHGNEDYDPHYEPIVPLPEAITVSTGEENETVMFNERAKLYRFDAETKEWKERGVGQLKILWHPEKNTYRLLLRREQVFKIVLNQLITSNFELQPMTTSDKAWTWAGYNYTDDENCFEKLAVRFKTQQLAVKFSDAIKDVMYNILDTSNRSEDVPVTVEDFGNDNGDNENNDDILNSLDNEGNDEYDYDEEDEDEIGYDGVYNGNVMYTQECSLSELGPDDQWHDLGSGYIQLVYDTEIYTTRTVFKDDNGITLSNTIIGINTELKRDDNKCIWKAVERADGNLRWRTLRLTFYREEYAIEFYISFNEGLHMVEDIVDELPTDEAED